jgi:hypothetical protein
MLKLLNQEMRQQPNNLDLQPTEEEEEEEDVEEPPEDHQSLVHAVEEVEEVAEESQPSDQERKAIMLTRKPEPLPLQLKKDHQENQEHQEKERQTKKGTVTLQYNREIQQNLSITLCGLPMRITISF